MTSSSSNGALLPKRGVKIGPGFIEYLCIHCDSHWLLFGTSRGLGFVFSPQNAEERLDLSLLVTRSV